MVLVFSRNGEGDVEPVHDILVPGESVPREKSAGSSISSVNPGIGAAESTMGGDSLSFCIGDSFCRRPRPHAQSCRPLGVAGADLQLLVAPLSSSSGRSEERSWSWSRESNPPPESPPIPRARRSLDGSERTELDDAVLPVLDNGREKNAAVVRADHVVPSLI